MSSSERRRGGSSHVLRSSPSRAHRQNSGGTSGSNTTSHNRDAVTNSGSTTGMPAPPPKVAMVHNNGSPSPDEPHDGSSATPTGSGGGGVILAERKDKDSEGTTSRRGSSAGRQQRERDEATAALLRDKDERIAHLEREMAIMEREFHRELDKLSANESETAVFWQGKHSALNHQFLRADTELRLLRAEAGAREGEREELRRGWEALRRRLGEREDEVRGLRGQVRGLKEFVSMSTRSDGQTSDEEFGDGMTRLGNGLQNWVIVHFRRAKLDLENVDEATLAEVSELVPMYEELAGTAKVHLLQSLVSRILVEMVFDDYYVGLSEKEPLQFRHMEETLASLGMPDESINQWRSSTLALLRDKATDLHDETTPFASAVAARINRVLISLLPMASPASEARDTALQTLVGTAIDLSRRLRTQRAVLRADMPVVLPHQRTIFEGAAMEDVGGGEDSDGDDDDPGDETDEDGNGGAGGNGTKPRRQREICCVVFPGLVKRGDESGGHLQYRNVIAKARVLCSPEVEGG